MRIFVFITHPQACQEKKARDNHTFVRFRHFGITPSLNDEVKYAFALNRALAAFELVGSLDSAVGALRRNVAASLPRQMAA